MPAGVFEQRREQGAVLARIQDRDAVVIEVPEADSLAGRPARPVSLLAAGSIDSPPGDGVLKRVVWPPPPKFPDRTSPELRSVQ